MTNASNARHTFRALLLLCCIFLLPSCAASRFQLHKKYAQSAPLVPQECFNNYQAWFDRYDPTDKKLDLTLTVRVRAFGRQGDKEATWKTEWQAKHPDWGPIPRGAAVSADPIEVWMDLREDGRGNLMLPPHVLGHEMEHAVIMYHSRLNEPVTVKYVLNTTVIPKHCFDNYEEWFQKLYPTDKQIDVILTVRIRAFGRQKDKEAAWDKEWRTKFPDWGRVTPGATVTSTPIEIWMNLKQDKTGNVIMPPHVLGHEMEHALIVHDSRIQDPHLRLEEFIYERPNVI